MADRHKTFAQVKNTLAVRVASVRARDIDSLPRRDREALCLIAAGLSNQGIRDALTSG